MKIRITKKKFHNKNSDFNNNIEHSEFQRIDNVEDFNDTLSKEEIIDKLGRKYKKNLVSIAKLLKHIKYNQPIDNIRHHLLKSYLGSFYIILISLKILLHFY